MARSGYETAPDILELLDGVEFPASQADLISYAYDQDASEEAVEVLRALPDSTFNHMQDVRENIGKIDELPGVQQWGSEPSEDMPHDPERI
ncbi:MAG: hypothetical protein DI586_07325 [Micavibrio aeruginosavorus]|uniref:DUF2795 domain-containing protein n=1 Tax=Micavibrio aeruginosavorus TaxID=349221 RepID=A0A2W5HI21_9BACT|nr:MAG: hypothetical protein DI586_07325 [Micavibrio aeruginosavorus]